MFLQRRAHAGIACDDRVAAHLTGDPGGRPGLYPGRQGWRARAGRRHPRGPGRGAGKAAGDPQDDHRGTRQGQDEGGEVPAPTGEPGPETARAPPPQTGRPQPPRHHQRDGADQHPAPRRLRLPGRSPHGPGLPRQGSGIQQDITGWRTIVIFPAHTHHPPAAHGAAAIWKAEHAKYPGSTEMAN